jgi:hypothetical protein
VDIHKASCAVIENVHSMPKQGVSSTFKFGRAFGSIVACVQVKMVPVFLEGQ